MKTEKNTQINGALRRFILSNIGDGATRATLEAASRAHTGSANPGVYQALRALEAAGLVYHETAKPNGARGRAPFIYLLTEAGVAAAAA